MRFFAFVVSLPRFSIEGRRRKPSNENSDMKAKDIEFIADDLVGSVEAFARRPLAQRRQRRSCALPLIILTLILSAITQDKAMALEPSSSDLAVNGVQFVDLMVNGDFAAAHAQFDSPMKDSILRGQALGFGVDDEVRRMVAAWPRRPESALAKQFQ
jgi:hypothetical protein